jgi:hypothetical protein
VVDLDQLRKDVGDAIDVAMGRVDFEVLPAQYTDLSDIHVIDDVPAVIYYWSLNLYREAVIDVVEVTDEEKRTGYAVQHIPHEIVMQIRVLDEEAAGADAMRDALLAGFGDGFCQCGVDFVYRDVGNSANEFGRGVHQWVFTYSGLAFLEGRTSETVPLAVQTLYQLHIANSFHHTPDEEEVPDTGVDPVLLEEILEDEMEV